jgi:hypothetical protein
MNNSPPTHRFVPGGAGGRLHQRPLGAADPRAGGWSQEIPYTAPAARVRVGDMR